MKKLTKLAVLIVGTFISASSVFAATDDSNSSSTSSDNSTVSSAPSGALTSSYKTQNNSVSSDEVSGLYLGAKFGLSLERLKENFPTLQHEVKNKTKETPNAGLTLGFDFYPQYQVPIRAELDYTYRKSVNTKENDKTVSITDNVRLQTGMLNAYYDIHTDSPLTPYIGAGIGYTNLKLESKDQMMSENGNHNKFAWTVGAGVGYQVNNHVDLLLGYQYLQTGKIKTPISEIEASSHDIFAGVNYYF